MNPSNCLTKGAEVYYAFCGITLIAAIWVVCRLYRDRSHMRISMGLLSITGSPLHSLPQFLLYPICHLLSGFCVITALITLYVFALGLQSIATQYDETSPGGRSRTLEFKWTEELLFCFICCLCAIWMVFLGCLYRFVVSFAVSTWYFCREKSQLQVKSTQNPIFRALKTCFRYHLGSLVYCALLKLLLFLPIALLRPIATYARSSPSHQKLRTCYLARCYDDNLWKYEGQSVVYMALFGERYGEAAEKAVRLAARNLQRTGLPLIWGSYLTSCYKGTIALSGVALAYGWVLLRDLLPNGQLSVEITLQPAIGLAALGLSLFAAEVFAGGMEICLETVLFCAACDEEMFSGEQRFIGSDLQDFLDQIAEEQNEQFRLYSVDLKPAKRNRIANLQDNEEVVKDEDWKEGVTAGPRNPHVRNNFKPLYSQAAPHTPSTRRNTASPEAGESTVVTRRANQMYERPETLGTPRILITPDTEMVGKTGK